MPTILANIHTEFLKPWKDKKMKSGVYEENKQENKDIFLDENLMYNNLFQRSC